MIKLLRPSLRYLAKAPRLAAVALAAFVTGTASAATPLAVWDGDFDTATTRNGVALDLNGNTSAATPSVGSTAGISFTLPTTYRYAAIAFTVSGLENAAANNVLLTIGAGSSPHKVGVYLKAGSDSDTLVTGGIDGGSAWGTTTYDGSLAKPSGDRTFVATYDAGLLNATSGDGLHLYETTSGSAVLVYGGANDNPLHYSSTKCGKITIGGGTAAFGSFSSFSGLVIKKAVVFGSETALPIDSDPTAVAAFSYPAHTNTDSTSISALNALVDSDAATTFVNFTDTVTYLTADATIDSKLQFADSFGTISTTLTDTSIAVSGTIPVKPGSSITAVTGDGIVLFDGTTFSADVTTSLKANTWTGEVRFDGTASATIPNDGITYHLYDSTVSGVTVNGILKTHGTTSLTSLTTAAGSTLQVVDGTTSVAADVKNAKGKAHLIVDAGATLSITTEGFIAYNDSAATVADIYGTLNLNGAKQYLYAANTLNLYAGGTITGTSGTQVLDIAHGQGLNVLANGSETTATFSAKARFAQQSGKTHTIAVANGVTLNVTQQIYSSQSHDVIYKTGSGILAISSNPATCGLVVNEGTLKLSGVTMPADFSLTMATSTTLEITSASTAKGSVTVASDATVTVDASAFASTTAVRETLLSWTAAPAGTFTLSEAISGYTLHKESSGLYLRKKNVTNGTTSETYDTIQEALDDATEGDTLTLTENHNEDSFIVNKNITITARGHTITAKSCMISSGKILTIDSNKRNTFDTLTGGILNLTYSTAGNGRICVKNASSVESITGANFTLEACTAALTVSGDINVTGEVRVSDSTLIVNGTISATTLNLAASDVVGRTATDKGGTNREQTYVSASDIEATVYGSGIIETSGDIQSSGSGNRTIIGSVVGNKITFSGSGITTIYGKEVLSGNLEIANGTLKLGNPYELGTVTFDFDASSSIIEKDESGYITKICDSAGGSNYGEPNKANFIKLVSDESRVIFGGKPVFRSVGGGARIQAHDTVSSGSMTTFFVWRTGSAWTTYSQPLNDSASSGGSSWGVGLRNSTSDPLRFRHGSTYNGEGLIYVNGVSGGTISTTDHVLTVCGCWIRSGKCQFGRGLENDSIAEILLYQEDFTLDERKSIDDYLMAKWGIGSATYSPISPSSTIYLASNAVLDLGGLTQTIASLSGSGTVQNGTLTVTDQISLTSGQTLVIPYGSTYTLADSSKVNVDENETAGTITLTYKAATIEDSGNITAYSTVQEAILAYTSGTLMIYEDATGIDIGTKDVYISGVQLADGVSVPTFDANLQYTASYSEGTISNVRVPKTYVWNGGVGAAWSTLSNWRINGGSDVPILAPDAGDTISFTSSANVTAAPSVSISAITLGSGIGTVTITGGNLTVSTAISMLAGNTLVIPNGSNYTLASDGTVAVDDTSAGTVTIRYPAATITDNETVRGYATVGEAILAYTTGTLTIYENATGIDLGTTDVDISGVVLADGVTTLTFEANLQYTASCLNGTITNVRNSKTYVWNGGVGAAWSTLSNWRINDGSDAPILIPGAGDSIAFTSTATVTAVPESTTVTAISLGSGIGTVSIAGESLTISTAISVTAGNTLVIPYGSSYTTANDGTYAVEDSAGGTVTITHRAADIDGIPYDTVRGAILAYESGTLTIYENATDVDLGTTDYAVETVVLDEGVAAPTFVVRAPYVAKYENGTITNARVPSTYTWTPTGSSTDWNTLSNWRIGTATPVLAAGENDTVVFPVITDESISQWNVTISTSSSSYGNGITVGTVSISADVELHGYRTIETSKKNSKTNGLNGDYLKVSQITGSGNTLKLDKVLVRTGDSGASLDCNVCIEESKNGGFYCAGKTLTLNGNLSGAGTCWVYQSGNYNGLTFNGNNAKFSGIYNELVNSDVHRGRSSFTSLQAASASAQWNLVGYSDSVSYTIGDNFKVEGEYHLGELNGYVNVAGHKRTVTLIVGERDKEDFAFEGHMGRGTSGGSGDNEYYNHIRKMGSKKLTFSGDCVGNVAIAGGTYCIGSSGAIPYTGSYIKGKLTFEGEGATLEVTATTTDEDENIVFVDPSAVIKDNAAYPICFNSGTDNHTWATALDSSNTSGLVKKGSGTLTLRAAPAYTGDFVISVEAGKVVVPNTATNTKPAVGTKRTEVGDNFEYEKGPEIEKGSPTNVEDLDNQDAADAVAATYNVTLTDTDTAKGLMPSYYKVKATQVGATTTYTMSVVLDEAAVSPSLVAATPETTPMVVTTISGVTLTLDQSSLKPGLYYALGTKTSINGPVTHGDLQQYTGSSLSLTSSTLPSVSDSNSVVYYVIEVNDTGTFD